MNVQDDDESESGSEDEEEDDEDDALLRKMTVANPAMPPYIDARPTIKTYFKIYQMSPDGRSLSVHESAPDVFNFSQSWVGGSSLAGSVSCSGVLLVWVC